MHLVLATDAFAGAGGSETYLLTVAEHLVRLGHGVTIYARTLGDMAGLAHERAIPVVGELNELPSAFDAAITQDGGVAYELADHAPAAPQLFVCHSAMFDVQLPPLVPGVAGTTIALSDRVAQRLRALDRPPHVRRLTQPIDTERFTSRRAPSAMPTRALALGNYLRPAELELLTATWGRAGVEVVHRGAFSTPSRHPERELSEADIVVGKGRALLEAMSSGRPAYLYDAFGLDGWVTPDRYAALEADSFAGQASDAVASSERLMSDLSSYNPAMGTVNRQLILTHHSARRHAQDLIAEIQALDPTPRPTSTPNRELARLVRLRWRAEREAFGLRSDFADLEDRLQTAELAAADAQALAKQTAQALAEQTAHAAQELATATHAMDRLRAEAAARAADDQADRARLEAILSQRRVRLGMRVGRLADAVRGRVRGRR